MNELTNIKKNHVHLTTYSGLNKINCLHFLILILNVDHLLFDSPWRKYVLSDGTDVASIVLALTIDVSIVIVFMQLSILSIVLHLYLVPSDPALSGLLIFHDFNTVISWFNSFWKISHDFATHRENLNFKNFKSFFSFRERIFFLNLPDVSNSLDFHCPWASYFFVIVYL